MNVSYKTGAGVIVSFVLGVCAADILYAQAKPPGYIFVEIDVKDQDCYTKEFLPKAQALIKDFWRQVPRGRLQQGSRVERIAAA